MHVDPTIPPACRRIQALAERDPRRAVPLARRALHTLPSGDPLMYAWAQYTIGWALLCWERFDAARPHLKKAQALFDQHCSPLAALRCRHALLVADVMQLAKPDLEDDLALLAEQFIQAGAPADAARTWLYQAVLFNILGRAHDAEAILERVAPMIEATALDQARWLVVKGVAAIAHSRYTQAAELLIQAERLFTLHSNRLEVAKCRFQYAWMLLCQEQIDLALAHYHYAKRIFTQQSLSLRVAWCDKNIGLAHIRRGAYDAALPAILNALQHFGTLGRTGDVAGCQLNLGNLYFYAGLWDAALACYTRVEMIYEASGFVGERLIAQRNQAMVYRQQGRRDAAFARLATLEAQARRLGTQAELAEIWTEQARLYEAAGQIALALARYQQAHDLFQHIGNVPAAAECRLEQGWLLLRAGAIVAAEAQLRAAAAALEAQPHHRWRVAYGLARCAQMRGHVATALEQYRAALTTVAELRDHLASEEISSRLYQQAAHLHSDALRLAVKCGDEVAVLEIGEGQRALVLRRTLTSHLAELPTAYQAEHERLRNVLSRLVAGNLREQAESAAELDAALAAYGELLLHARHSVANPERATPVSAHSFDLRMTRAALRAAYGDDWIALVYSICDDTLLISMIMPDAVALEQIPFDASLQRLIKRVSRAEYRYYIYRDMPHMLGQTDQPWAGLHALADQLLPARVRARLHADLRLLIVPAGPLHALPWAALRLEHGWLVEQAVIQLAPSLAVWQALANRPGTRAGGALLVGCSAFGERAPALPAVVKELAAVAAHWPGHTTQLLDQEATRAALLKRSASGELCSYQLLHCATHAQLQPTRGLAAHLKLWDGDVLQSEVASLRLGAGLVTLSACESAAADPLPGEEVLSLSWACLAAGARGVLASLWPINDEASSQFMGRFYAALSAERDAALALAQTQRALLARYTTADAVTEPQSWGSFVLTGFGRLGE